MNSIGATATLVRHSRARARARRVVLRALRLLKKNGLALDIFTVSNRDMQELNRRYRHKNKPTNVLSFAAPEVRPPAGGPAERVVAFMRRSELYLAPDYIKGKGEDFDYLVIHGLLHLLGYDHEKKRDMMRMERLEGRLMKQLVIAKLKD